MPRTRNSRIGRLQVLLLCCLLCVIGFLLIWKDRRTIHSRSDEGARPRQLPMQERAAPPFTGQTDNTGDPRASLPEWRGGTFMKTTSASRAHTTIEICLVDEITQLPVALGHVILEERPSSATLFDQEVAGSGCVSIDADPGKYLMRLAASGYIAVVQSLDLNSNQDRVFKSIPMVRESVLRGMVRNAAGEAQPGASVVVVARGYRKTVLSGIDGKFEIQLFSNEIDKIYAFKPPHPVAETGPISIGGPNKSFIEITLPREAPAFKITARVFDDQARPVKGALVKVLATTGFHVADKEDDLVIQAAQGVSGISDADGRCTL
jgi:hypothetical protein